MTPNIFETLPDLSVGTRGKIQLADAINIHAQQGLVEVVGLNGLRSDCGSISDFILANNYKYKEIDKS